MNIIVSSLSSDKTFITGYSGSADIDSFKLFVNKSLDAADIFVELRTPDNSATYPLAKIQSSKLDKNDYFGYILSSRTAIANGEYYIYIIDAVNALEYKANESITLVNTQTLDDEHEPIYIINRTINPITTQVLAQDFGSQQFKFYIKKKYDGISFLDEGKEIYIDFIPVDGKDANGNEVPFLSDRITKITELTESPNGQEGEWLLLKWDLPYDATKLAGAVKFALSVLAKYGDARTYTWQTLPSSFTVSANIGKRGAIQRPPEEADTLEQRLSDIESFIGFQSDDDPKNDQELIISGGSAPIDNGEEGEV